jgi:hypothetical protein
MKKAVKAAPTKANLDKVLASAKKTKAAWGKKVVKFIDAMNKGDFNGEFKKLEGPHSQISEFFSHLGQALNY